MKKSYPIQHDFLFTDADLYEQGYVGEIKEDCSKEPGILISFSDFLKAKEEPQLEEIVFRVPVVTLFPPVLVLDEWPNEDDVVALEYAKILLKFVIERLNKEDIYPVVAKK